MTPEHHLKWGHMQRITMFAPSARQECDYSLTFCPGPGQWRATIASHIIIHKGTLQECVLACQEHEYEASEVEYDEECDATAEDLY